MSYTPTSWVNGELVSADDMNRIEQGITDAAAGGATDPAFAAVIADPVSATRVALDTRYPAKGSLVVNVKDFGAKGDGVTDDTTAIQSVLSTAKSILFPAGTYLVDGGVLSLDSKSGVTIEMVGRLKRKNASVRASTLIIYNSTDIKIKSFRSDGNVANNYFGGLPVDESKHCLRIDGSTDVEVGVVDSINPAGDAVYVTGATARLRIGSVTSRSDGATGRNAVSIVSGNGIVIGDVSSYGTGYTTMPGGFDIEPNNGQTVSNVTVGTVWVQTSATSGFTIYGNYTVGGVRQCSNITVGSVMLTKGSGVGASAVDAMFKGLSYVTVASLTVLQNAASTNYAMNIDDADHLTITNLLVPRSGKNFNIGATLNVDQLSMTGSYESGAAFTCLNITNLTNSKITMRLRCNVSGVLIVKQATGTSSNVTFANCDWRKDGTGNAAMQLNGAVTDWTINGCDFTGWTGNRVIGTYSTAGVKKFNCPGYTTLAAVPGNTGDLWIQGDRIENTSPASGGPPGWVCTTGGAYGTFVFKAQANLA